MSASTPELVDLARLLLTPAARVSDDDDGSPSSMVEWEKARIRWHRIDGNDTLADEMLRDLNKVNRALGDDQRLRHEAPMRSS